MQSSLYFESTKKNLEGILLSLSNQDIPLARRKKEYINLCKNFAVCSPGLFTHIEDVCHKLATDISVEKWLAAARTNLIKVFSDRYNTRNEIREGNTIHTFNSFATYADNQNWNPMNSTENYKDPHTYLSKINEQELIYFHAYFVKEWNFNMIKQCVETNINEVFVDLFDEFSYKNNQWNNVAQDFQRFQKKAEDIFDALGIKCSTEDYCELSEDYLKFRVTQHNLVTKICDKLFPPNIYFKKGAKTHKNLLLITSLDSFSTKDFDFRVWSDIPSTEFPEIFFNIINFITNDQAFTLIKELSNLQLFEMSCHTTLFKAGLAKLKNSDRRDFIKTLIYKKNNSYLAEVKNMPAHVAAQDNNVWLIQGLVGMESTLLSLKDSQQETPLHIAARLGHHEFITKLAEANIELDNENVKGETPFMLAFKQNNIQIMATLIEYKADINKPNSKNGKTPLAIAIDNANVRGIKFLLENGADNLLKDSSEYLEQAINNSSIGIVNIISQYNPLISDPESMLRFLKISGKYSLLAKEPLVYLCSHLEKLNKDDQSPTNANKKLLDEAKSYLKKFNAKNLNFFNEEPDKSLGSANEPSLDENSKNCVIS